jgi:hypothetical protein
MARICEERVARTFLRLDCVVTLEVTGTPMVFAMEETAEAIIASDGQADRFLRRVMKKPSACARV